MASLLMYIISQADGFTMCLHMLTAPLWSNVPHCVLAFPVLLQLCEEMRFRHDQVRSDWAVIWTNDVLGLHREGCRAVE